MALHDARLQVHHVREVLHGQHGQLFAGDGRRRGRQVTLHQRARGRDHHLLAGDRLLLEREVDFGGQVDLHAHLLHHLRRKADHGGPERIGARPYVQDDIVAVGIGRSALLRLQDHHVHTGQRLAGLRVGHAPDDLSLSSAPGAEGHSAAEAARSSPCHALQVRSSFDSQQLLGTEKKGREPPDRRLPACSRTTSPATSCGSRHTDRPEAGTDRDRPEGRARRTPPGAYRPEAIRPGSAWPLPDPAGCTPPA